LTAGWDFSDPDTPKQRNISYDAANMATDITLDNKQTTFLYDGDGKRVKKVQDGSPTFYIDDVFEVKDGSPIRYIFANNLRITMQKNDTLTYFHKDHLGSSNAMTNAEGKEISSAEYLPYGLTRGDVGITQSSYQFTDQELDTETGLYNYDARLYDPIVGQFVSVDSIVPDWYDPQSLNRFAYVRNNPVKYVDPSGHSFLLTVAVGAGLAYLADAMLTPDMANTPLNSSEPLRDTSTLAHAGSPSTGASIGTTLGSTGIKHGIMVKMVSYSLNMTLISLIMDIRMLIQMSHINMY
jgi:RHS repeat-associated protein